MAKTKTILSSYETLYSQDEHPRVSLKQLEKDVGFLVHVALTYPAIRPYLRSFYGSMHGWQHDRDDDGWKLTGQAQLRKCVGGTAKPAVTQTVTP